MKKAFKIFSIMFVIEIVLIAIFRCYGVSEKNFFINFLML